MSKLYGYDDTIQTVLLTRHQPQDQDINPQDQHVKFNFRY